MAAILKEILDRVEMPQQTADARLLSILCDEADINDFCYPCS